MVTESGQAMAGEKPPLLKKAIGFDLSKSPLFTPNDGYRIWQRRLKTSGWKVILNKDEIGLEFLNQVDIVVIPASRAKYSDVEFTQIRKFVGETSGKLLVLLNEGGEKRAGTNLNFLLEEYGISVNNDAVVRTAYFKYFHPKEALITDGVLNRSLHQIVRSLRASERDDDADDEDTENHQRKRPDKGSSKNEESGAAGMSNLTYVYPFGATLNVQKPAVSLLSTGTVCYPLQRPTCAVYADPARPQSGGRLVVLASAHVLHDQYIEKEDNRLIKDILMSYLTTNEIRLNPIDAKDPEVADYHAVPDLESLAEVPFCCLQEGEDIPSDYMKLFSRKLYALENAPLATILMAYEEMQMEIEPLRLIKPQFETPLPSLSPAVFPPNWRLPPKPKLELFDLDDAFSSAQTRLMQIANKCSDADLDYYIKESGLVMGIADASSRSAKSVLYHIFSRIVEYKKINVNEQSTVCVSVSLCERDKKILYFRATC